MADDPRYRTQRSDPHLQDRTSRSASAAPQDDPLAELARLIGQDEAFIAASRHGAQAKDRDAQHGSERDSPAPSWLTRASQRLSQARSGSGAYEPETSPRDSGRGGDVETDIAPRLRQMPSRWDAAAEDDEVRYGAGHGAQDGAHQEWHESRGDPEPQEEFDPFRIAAHEGRYDSDRDTERYDEGGDPASRIDPFDSAQDRLDHGDEQGSRLRRRGGILTIAAVLGLAAVGTAAAFGYRAWTSGPSSAGQPPLIKADTAPTKLVPAQAAEGQQNKLIYDRIGEKIQSSTDKVVSREEQPIELRDMARQSGARPALPAPGTPGTVMIGAQPPAYAAPPSSTGNPGPNEPKKVHTITIRPDQGSTTPGPEADALPNRSGPTPTLGPGVPPPPAARSPVPAPAQTKPSGKPSATAPLALNPSGEPTASAGPRTATGSVQPAPYRTAALPSATDAGNYVVQISSQRSETEAQASFRALQTKYPNVLGSWQPLIRRADLGSKGVYYRAQVGPFGTAEDANQLCSNLKAAGGQCIVQRN